MKRIDMSKLLIAAVVVLLTAVVGLAQPKGPTVTVKGDGYVAARQARHGQNRKDSGPRRRAERSGLQDHYRTRRPEVEGGGRDNQRPHGTQHMGSLCRQR